MSEHRTPQNPPRLTNKRKDAITQLLADYSLAKFEAQALLPLVEARIARLEADNPLRNQDPSVYHKTLEFLLDKKAHLEKGLRAIESNIFYYRERMQ